MKFGYTCCFCGKKVRGLGNYAGPIKEGNCCKSCYDNIVIPVKLMIEKLSAKKNEDKNDIVEVS